MVVIKELSERGLYDIVLKQSNKELIMTFGGNLDLYWILIDKNRIGNVSEFLITKENYRIFSAFDRLFDRIEKSEVYHDLKKDYYINEYEKENDIANISSLNMELQQRRDFWYPFKNGMIHWYSDDGPIEDVNVLKIIRKDEDSYLIEFESNPKSFSKNSVCFCNSGSRHNPYNIVFQEMFNDLQNYDVYDLQVYFEEERYQKKIGTQKS